MPLGANVCYHPTPHQSELTSVITWTTPLRCCHTAWNIHYKGGRGVSQGCTNKEVAATVLRPDR